MAYRLNWASKFNLNIRLNGFTGSLLKKQYHIAIYLKHPYIGVLTVSVAIISHGYLKVNIGVYKDYAQNVSPYFGIYF